VRLPRFIRRPPTAAAVSPVHAQILEALARRRASRPANQERAARAAATRWRAQIERDPLFNRGIRG